MSDDGGTIGTYAAWRFIPHWRLDGMVGWSDIFYNASAGTASGAFTGSRFISSGGATGTYAIDAMQFEPSARIYSLFESENAWTDSLGTLQAARNFSENLARAGGKLIYPWQVADLQISPYVGFYADFRFSSDNALPAAAPLVGIVDGWSARATAGISATGRDGETLALGGELGGVGAGYQLWSVNAQFSLPF